MTRIVRFCRAALRWSAALGAMALVAGQALAQTPAPAPAPAPAATPTAPRPAAPRPRAPLRPHHETAPAQPEAPPPTSAGQQVTRIPPPGPAEVPLFPARDYTDPRTNMSMTVPAGWLVIEAPNGGDLSHLFIEGPGSPPPSCTVVVLKPQQPANITQPLINRMLQDDRNLGSVRSNLGQQGRRVNSIRKVVQNGIAGIVAQVLIPGSSTSPDVTMFVAFFEAVGKRFSFNCTALTNDLDTMRPDIEAMFRSLKFN